MTDTLPDHPTQAALAARLPAGTRLGTSSWTFPGWKDLVYGGRYPAKASAAALLARYAAHPLFGTVGIDSSYYRPLDERQCAAYTAVLPAGFPCVSKAWNRLTVHTATATANGFTRGERNPHFLDAALARDAVLGPLEAAFAGHVGPVVFEFPWVPAATGLTPDRFAAALDAFLSALPRTLPLAVEVRNVEYLTPAYFAVLREHGAAHVFNQWSRMPRIGYQLELPDCLTAAFVVARALLQPGSGYEASKERYAPFDRRQAPDATLHDDLVALVRTATAARLPAFVLVNNKAEGSAPLTVLALAERLAGG